MLRNGRPLLPFAEVRFLQGVPMAHDIALDGKVSNIDLDLPGNYQAIFCERPLKLITQCQANKVSSHLTCV